MAVTVIVSPCGCVHVTVIVWLLLCVPFNGVGAFLHSNVWLWLCVSLSWSMYVPWCGHVAVVVNSTVSPMTVDVDEKCSCVWLSLNSM